MFFVCATLPSSATFGAFNGEDTKTSSCWQCDHTERASPGMTSATLVTSSGGDFGNAVLMMIRRFMGTEKIRGLEWIKDVARCGSTGTRHTVAQPVQPLVRFVVGSGPIMSWCQSFVLVRFHCRSREGSPRDSHMAAKSSPNFWIGTGSRWAVPAAPSSAMTRVQPPSPRG